MPTLFPLGRTVCTAALLERVPEAEMYESLLRHGRGDWGDVCEEDGEANEEALKSGQRIVSIYHTKRLKQKFYIITEWDRSVTTVLLPEDY